MTLFGNGFGGRFVECHSGVSHNLPTSKVDIVIMLLVFLTQKQQQTGYEKKTAFSSLFLWLFMALDAIYLIPGKAVKWKLRNLNVIKAITLLG